MEWIVLAGIALAWFVYASWRKGQARSAPPGEGGVQRPKRQPAALAVVESTSYPREVVGEGSYQAELLAICGGYSRDGHDYRTTATLIPEPDNPHDTGAVQVVIEGRKVGYLARGDAERYHAGLTKAGHPGASVRCGAKVVGGWKTNQHDAGHFGVYLALKWPLKLA